MIVRLQVNTDGEWATLNTREGGTEDALVKIRAELNHLQMMWATNYEGFADARFRIVEERR